MRSLFYLLALTLTPLTYFTSAGDLTLLGADFLREFHLQRRSRLSREEVRHMTYSGYISRANGAVERPHYDV